MRGLAAGRGGQQGTEHLMTRLSVMSPATSVPARGSSDAIRYMMRDSARALGAGRHTIFRRCFRRHISPAEAQRRASAAYFHDASHAAIPSMPISKRCYFRRAAAGADTDIAHCFRYQPQRLGLGRLFLRR